MIGRTLEFSVLYFPTPADSGARLNLTPVMRTSSYKQNHNNFIANVMCDLLFHAHSNSSNYIRAVHERVPSQVAAQLHEILRANLSKQRVHVRVKGKQPGGALFRIDACMVQLSVVVVAVVVLLWQACKVSM